MAKCRILRNHEAAWAWQPFGPDERPTGSFATLGNHYRGFPVIKVSDEAKQRIENLQDGGVPFDHKGRTYIVTKDGVKEV